jgi:hypothetical protein
MVMTKNTMMPIINITIKELNIVYELVKLRKEKKRGGKGLYYPFFAVGLSADKRDVIRRKKESKKGLFGCTMLQLAWPVLGIKF